MKKTFKKLRKERDSLGDDKYKEMVSEFIEGEAAAQFKSKVLRTFLNLSVSQLNMDKLDELMKATAGKGDTKRFEDASRIIGELCFRETDAKTSQEGEK